MKITAAVLAQQIADYVTKETQSQVTSDEILVAVPALRHFDTMAEQLETAFQDMQQALDDQDYWDEDNFEATRDACAKAYKEAVGVPPLPPPLDVDDDDEDDENDDDDE